MSEGKDSTIKLFGKIIPLLEVLSYKREIDSKPQGDGNLKIPSKEAVDLNGITPQDDNPKTPTVRNESSESKTEDDQRDTKSSQDKSLKKPDEILPCPRCDSMETKFCYYNNYNVSQPRHFCKNCQRYWTAGGTMRNVAVGSGRRRNKNPTSQYCQVSVSEGVAYGAPYPTASPNGAVLAFRSDTPLCESMASALIADKNIQNFSQNGFLKPETLETLLKDQSSMSSNKENGENGPNIVQNSCIYPPQLPFFAGPTWPYPSQWVPPPGVIPMPFYPAPPFWGYAIRPPWVTPSLSTSLNSPALGKHCRDEDSSRQSDHGEKQEEREEICKERSLWFPKTFRIDDPGEAAKRSIWETSGIKHKKRDPKGGIFKAFKSNANEKSDRSDTSPLLQANPAALSRWRNFYESS